MAPNCLVIQIFMRDAEKLLLDDQLHRVIMTHIVKLQGWFRTVVARKRFIKIRKGVVTIQAAVRGMLVRGHIRQQALAALCIQTYWRSYNMRSSFVQLRNLTIAIQAHARGWMVRQRFRYEHDGYAVKLGIIRGSSAKLFQIQQFFHAFALPSFEVKNFDQLNEDDSYLTSKAGTSTSASDLQELMKPLHLTDGRDEISPTPEFEEEVDDPTVKYSFVLENHRLKLIGAPIDEDNNNEIMSRRRQSLAIAPSQKLGLAFQLEVKTLRRAASTENQISLLGPLDGLDGGDPRIISHDMSPKLKKKSGFFRATEHLKAFLSNRKSDSLRDSDDDEVTGSFKSVATTSPPSTDKAPLAARHSMFPGNVGYSLESSESTVITHSLKLTRIHKTENCAICARPISGFFIQGFKCSICKLCFHKECNQFASKLPCSLPTPHGSRSLSPRSPPPVTNRRPWDVGGIGYFMRSPKTSFSQSVRTLAQTSFNITRAKQQTDPADSVVASIEDLRALSTFMFQKQAELAAKSSGEQKRATIMDSIFKMSLREYHSELISYEATIKEENGVRYLDLITSFEGCLSKVCIREQVNFPLTLGVNAFRGFMNEFVQQQSKMKHNKAKSRVRSLRKKRRKSDLVVVHMAHRFGADIVHVPTFCEVCNQFMWHSEKIFICQLCRISCHKKCHSKLSQNCEKAGGEVPEGCRIFGVELSQLVDEDNTVPLVLETLFTAVELRGLYIEGIYRKNGSVVQVKQMRRLIEAASDSTKLRFDDTQVHVLSALIKAFFREAPEPLMTYDLYENFINVSEVDQPVERLRCLSVMIDLLPKAHRACLDRLMYHLARVAHQEEVNKMGPSNLATIFAPCLLRRPQAVHAQEQLQDVNRQAICIQTLIEEKLRQYRNTMEEIVQLEHVTETVAENLRKIESHVHNQTDEQTNVAIKEMEQARQLFVEQLEFLDKEKDRLIEDLPPLAPVASSEEDLTVSSDDATPTNRRKGRGRGQQTEQEEYALDLNSAPVFPVLLHLNKHRAQRNPRQRVPSKRFIRMVVLSDRF